MSGKGGEGTGTKTDEKYSKQTPTLVRYRGHCYPISHRTLCCWESSLLVDTENCEVKLQRISR